MFVYFHVDFAYPEILLFKFELSKFRVEGTVSDSYVYLWGNILFLIVIFFSGFIIDGFGFMIHLFSFVIDWH